MGGCERAYGDIVRIARDHGATKVVLFGSRARGDALPKSDIDVAVAGSLDFDALYDDLQNEVDSLLCIDAVNLDAPLTPELRQEIARDGVVIYEKV